MRRYLEKNIQDKARIVRVVGDAFWSMQCNGHLHATHDDVLRPYIGEFIIICNKSQEEHVEHMQKVFDLLMKHHSSWRRMHRHTQ